MTEDCRDCSMASKVWHWGGYKASCKGCEIRAIAVSPAHIRKAFYDKASKLDLPSLKVSVASEFHRIKNLKLMKM